MNRFAVAISLLLAAILILASTDDAFARKGRTQGVSTCAASGQPAKCTACVNDGNNWVEGQGCLDKACTNNNKVYFGGDTIRVGGRWYMCNGLTGNWEQFASTAPQPPTTSHPLRPDSTAPAKPRWP